MTSRPKQAAPRPVPRLYLTTPAIVDPSAFSSQLTAALDAGDVAAVLLRFAGTDERTRINCAKALSTPVQGKGAALLLDGHVELVTRHDAMLAAEQGADYVMFGDPDVEGRRPALPAIEERVAWWAEVFEIPCVGYAASLGDIAPLVAAGADFIALGDFLWRDSDKIASTMSEVSGYLKLPEPTA